MDPVFDSKYFAETCGVVASAVRSWVSWSRARHRRGILSSLWTWFFLLVFSCSLSVAANRIDVPVKINGQVMRFGFDTGAGAEVALWQDVAALMALPSKSLATGPLSPGHVAVELSDPVAVEFFGTKSPEARIAVIKGPDYAKWEIQGLVGWPAVRNNIWKIDLGRSGLGIIGSVPAEAEGWLKYRVSQKKETLVLEIPRGDGVGLLAIDTGSQGGVALSPRLWNEWKNAHSGPPAVLEGHEMLATGIALAEVTAAEQWSIDKLTLSKVLLEQAHPTEIAIYGDAYLATLGFDALRKLTLIVDGKNGWAYLQPHESSARLGLYNRLGATFIPAEPQGGELEARVAPESPAAMAGLRNGDRLLKLNGLDVEHWRQRPGSWPLAEFFNQPPGTRLDCVVKRDGQNVAVRPVLQEILSFKNVPPHPAFEIPPRPDFHFIPPLAGLVRRAGDLGIPITSQSKTPVEGFMQKGDTVTALVTSVDEGKIRQWLVLFSGNDLKPQEKKAERKKPTLYTLSGREVRFDHTPVRGGDPHSRAFHGERERS
ncbi:MAG: PDZ domain-containing protein [Nibricoccus sp.]